MTESVVEFDLDGQLVTVADGRRSLLDVLRNDCGRTSVKDGCSPQGQCGCCTVWVDGSPRVACVTPVGRVRGRRVTTVDGLADGDRWAAVFTAAGASQCGFCTPGIIMRLAALDRPADPTAIDRALKAHLCRCTGWQTIHEAAEILASSAEDEIPASSEEDENPASSAEDEIPASSDTAVASGGMAGRDPEAAARRAALEGRATQEVGPAVALGRGGFAEDTAPAGALVAVMASDGSWVVGETDVEARAAAGVIPGRRSTAPITWPVEVPPGDWVRVLRTTWLEPAALELDATWCSPGGTPAPVVGNGGAFGGKESSPLPAIARRLADVHGRPVRVRWTREDAVRRGRKRPPLALGLRADGSGTVTLVRPSEVADQRLLEERIAAVAPRVEVGFVDVAGPAVSAALRGAGWAEVAAACATVDDAGGGVRVASPDGAWATAELTADRLAVRVSCGPILDEVVLRSYCIGAAHMALGMVRREGLAVDDAGTPVDLTIRSFGILRADEMPPVDVTVVTPGPGEAGTPFESGLEPGLEPGPGPVHPVNGSDAVFAATFAAAWRAAGYPREVPTGSG